MQSSGLISVIIIFYNAARFMNEGIASVFAQTYEDWELLLVDDGSTDESTEIALGYADRFPGRVRYLAHGGRQNRGMSASRNLGIRHSEGQYVAFLDADDIWLPNKLEQQVTILNSERRAGMVYGATQVWYSWTKNLEDHQRDQLRKLGLQGNVLVEPPKLLAMFLRREAQTPGICSVMVRRETIEAVGGFEEIFGGLYEDQVFIAKVCLQTPVFVASECWDRYRQHPDSTCRVAERKGQISAAHMTYLTWLEKYLSEKGFRKSEVWQALQNALWPYRHPVLLRLSHQARHLKGRTIVLLKEVAWRTLPRPLHSWLKARWRGQRYA